MSRCLGCGKFYRFQYDDAEAICEPCLKQEENKQATFADRVERKHGLLLSGGAILEGSDTTGSCKGLA